MSDQLRALGIDLIEGFGTEQLALKPDVWVVGNVVSRARQADGTPLPLMEAILDRGLRYTSGPQWLAEHVLQGRHVLAVAGTHGKTTTTAMLAWILEHAGLQPGFLVGGVRRLFRRLARMATGAALHALRDRGRRVRLAFFDKRASSSTTGRARPSSTTWSSTTRTSSTTWPRSSGSSTISCAPSRPPAGSW